MIFAHERVLHCLGCVGYKPRVKYQPTRNNVKEHRQDHGQHIPEPTDDISDTAYERAVAQLIAANSTARQGTKRC